jgi:hypothetical protein
MKEERNSRMKEGKKTTVKNEGRTEGRKDGRTDGRTEGRKDGKKKVYHLPVSSSHAGEDVPPSLTS